MRTTDEAHRLDNEAHRLIEEHAALAQQSAAWRECEKCGCGWRTMDVDECPLCMANWAKNIWTIL